MQPAHSVHAATSTHPVAVEGLGANVRCHELEAGRPPLFIEPMNGWSPDIGQFVQWARGVKPILDELIIRYGGIVLRGFPTKETPDFAAFIDLFPAFEQGYAGGRAPRAVVSGRVMEATRLDASVRLVLHSEMAYLGVYPKRIAFFARLAATKGGETTVADARALTDRMDPMLAEKISRHGARMVRNFGPKSDGLDASYDHLDKRGWNQSFYTDDPAEVERICAERDMKPVWNADGGLTVFNELQPFVVHPATGKRLFRSNLHVRPQVSDIAIDIELKKTQKYPSGPSLGNGECLTEAEVTHLNEICDAVTYAWPWRNGDVMVLDNLQVWHGRNPYEGPRDVQVALLN